jgi:hypothetical protein
MVTLGASDLRLTHGTKVCKTSVSMGKAGSAGTLVSFQYQREALIGGSGFRLALAKKQHLLFKITRAKRD